MLFYAMQWYVTCMVCSVAIVSHVQFFTSYLSNDNICHRSRLVVSPKRQNIVNTNMFVLQLCDFILIRNRCFHWNWWLVYAPINRPLFSEELRSLSKEGPVGFSSPPPSLNPTFAEFDGHRARFEPDTRAFWLRIHLPQSHPAVVEVVPTLVKAKRLNETTGTNWKSLYMYIFCRLVTWKYIEATWLTG